MTGREHCGSGARRLLFDRIDLARVWRMRRERGVLLSHYSIRNIISVLFLVCLTFFCVTAISGSGR